MSSRSKAIADSLTRAIIAHRLVPGCKLGERELAEIFGVSRIVVRQALVRLEEEYLVRIERNRGAFVAKPSLQEAIDIYDALTLVEQGVATQQIDRPNPRMWAQLRQHVERQKQAIDDKNDALADVLAQEFHQLFVSLGRSKTLQDIHAQLNRRATLMKLLVPADYDFDCLLTDHSDLIDLLEKKRLKQACELIASHYREIVRSFALDASPYPELPLKEALAPFVEDEKSGETSSRGQTPNRRNTSKANPASGGEDDPAG